MARAATSPELTIYRTPGKKSLFHAAFLKPPIVYRARVNQTFTSLDLVMTIIYDGGSGTLADVLPDMEVWIGSALDGHDKGICRLRDKDSTHLYLSETSEIAFADNDYVTILAGYGMWARPARILEDGTVYMDEVEYTDQHTNWDPQPNMGPHQVVELVETTVEVSFHGGSSFCLGSSIDEWAWSCSTASAASDLTLEDVTFQFNTTGWHIVYLTLTAANGKIFFGVRYVYVWNTANPPFEAEISNPGRCDVDSGGWEIELTLFGGVGLGDVYERAMVILFSEDYYGPTKQTIGPVAGSENIKFIGWISKEDNHLSAEQGSVTFTAHGSAYWMGKIPSWPDGVELTTGTPDWTSIVNLTVDLGVYHFLRHRTTATRIMDITLTGDTRISNQVSSSAQDLWSQIQEMTWAQIYARPGVNSLNQLSIQIHPSLIPTADRSYPTVMAITKADYEDDLEFERLIVDEVGIVDMSGVQVTGPDDGSAWFALAPGHSLPHYGAWDIQPNLLLASQAQVITLAGLYRSWKNNPFPSIPLVLKAPIGLIDCFPNQRYTISIATGDNVRGFAYSGGLIPAAVQLVQDPDTGYAHTEVTFEAETNESQSRVGDTPGGDPTDRPTTPSLPPIVLPPIIIPGGVPATDNAPQVVLLHSTTYGWAYTTNFNAAVPNWILMNGGLTTDMYQNINVGLVCPNGSIYTGIAGEGDGSGIPHFLARAAAAGGLWTIVEDHASIYAKYPGNLANGIGIAGFNPLVPETIAYVIGYPGTPGTNHLWIGGGGSYAQKVALPNLISYGGARPTYGFGQWRVTGQVLAGVATPHVWLISTDGATITEEGNIAGDTDTEVSDFVFPVGSTPIVFTGRAGFEGLYKYSDNFRDVPVYLPENVNNGWGFAVDPAGLLIMAQWDAGAKGKSGDGGYSYSALASLPPGFWYFAYVSTGGTASASRWVAVGSSSVRYSDNFGSTWINKEGDILTAFPAGGIDRVLVVG